MNYNMEYNKAEKELDITEVAPVEEPIRQYYFIKKAKKYVQQVSREIGRPLTFCVTTFGCQMNFVCETA